MDAGVARSVLLTGFGPFPCVEHNVSGALAVAVAETSARRHRDHRFRAEVLPTEWAGGLQLAARLIEERRPELIIHFGVAAGADGLRLERSARNDCRLRHDAAGALPVGRLLAADGPAARASTLPIDRIVAHLSSLGHPVEVSDDAGGYLCNAVLYETLGMLERTRSGALAGFVHVPADLESGPLKPVDAVEACAALIAVCLDELAATAN